MLLQQAYNAQCLLRPTVKGWHRLYSEDSTKLGVVPRGLTKRTVATVVNVNTVAATIQKDRHLSIRKLESMLNIPKSTIHLIKMCPLIPNKKLLISYFLEFHFLTGVPVTHFS